MHMETPLPVPAIVGYTVLSKSGCQFCDKVKALLLANANANANTQEVQSVNCDEFLSGPLRDPFLAHLTTLTRQTQKQVRFPLVFHNSVFIGGYLDTKSYLEHGADADDF